MGKALFAFGIFLLLSTTPALAQDKTLVDALVSSQVRLAREFKATDASSALSRDVVIELVPAASALRTQFDFDGATGLLSFLSSASVKNRLERPAHPAEQQANFRRQFSALVLAHAKQTDKGLFVTGQSVQQLSLTLAASPSWFCPCWPFC